MSHQSKTSIMFMCLDLGIGPDPIGNLCHLLIKAGAQPESPLQPRVTEAPYTFEAAAPLRVCFSDLYFTWRMPRLKPHQGQSAETTCRLGRVRSEEKAAPQRRSWLTPAKVALAEGAGRRCPNWSQLVTRLQVSHQCDNCLQTHSGKGEEEDWGIKL